MILKLDILQEQVTINCALEVTLQILNPRSILSYHNSYCWPWNHTPRPPLRALCFVKSLWILCSKGSHLKRKIICNEKRFSFWSLEICKIHESKYLRGFVYANVLSSYRISVRSKHLKAKTSHLDTDVTKNALECASVKKKSAINIISYMRRIPCPGMWIV